MILQLDRNKKIICAEWLSVIDIEKNTSFKADRVLEAIDSKREFGGYYWLEAR